MLLLRVHSKKYINHAAKTQLYAAEDLCAAQNLLCIPLVFESFGGMTKNTEETLLRTARFYCHRLSIENIIGITQLLRFVFFSEWSAHNGADKTRSKTGVSKQEGPGGSKQEC